MTVNALQDDRPIRAPSGISSTGAEKEQLLSAILWHSAALTRFEYFELDHRTFGYALRGVVLARLEGEPAEVVYDIECDRHWQTRRVGIVQTCNSVVTALTLRVSEKQDWYNGNTLLPELGGLFDVDLAITPSTNLLPLKRQPVAVGGTLETRSAWVQFPSLDITPLTQTYTRTGEREYAYAAPSLDYKARLTFDADGVCESYGGLWARV